MNVHSIWNEFLEKLKHDSFSEDDFTDDNRVFLFPFLSGYTAQFRREKYIKSPAELFDGENKKIVIFSCPDDKYRFDFIIDKGKWRLCFIECITLPIANINNFPYSSFTALPEKEAWIYAEKSISKTIHFFCKLRELIGFENALLWFNDGAGEYLCAKSWVPFYKESKAFIIYCAWIENRINGEDVSVEMFEDTKCIIRFVNHLWFSVYHVSTHIKTQLTLDEYKILFEHIWTDRAINSGWSIDFKYDGSDSVLIFYIPNN